MRFLESGLYHMEMIQGLEQRAGDLLSKITGPAKRSKYRIQGLIKGYNKSSQPSQLQNLQGN